MKFVRMERLSEEEMNNANRGVLIPLSIIYVHLCIIREEHWSCEREDSGQWTATGWTCIYLCQCMHSLLELKAILRCRVPSERLHIWSLNIEHLDL